MKTRRIRVLAVVVLMAAWFQLGAGPAGAAPVDTYVNCESSDPVSDGSKDHPFKTLAQVNARTYGPGDRLMFRGGTTCTGMLAPAGAGAAEAVWKISNWGPGTARATIAGAGADNAVLLRNTQHVEISNLRLTNTSATANDRRGLHLLLEDFGTGTYYRVTNLEVDGVSGNEQGGVSSSQGILFSVAGSTTASRFHDVRISNNVVTNSSHGGIQVGSSYWAHRTEVGSTPEQIATRPWTAHTGVVVTDNTISDVGASGIMVEVSQDALVANNTVNGHSSIPTIGSVGIWTINANGTTIQSNSVTGGQQAERDGMAYDADYATIGAKIQYNYSADNAGGFALLCPVTNKPTIDPVIRYNISQNDRTRGIALCGGNLQNAQIYNNTIYIGDGRSMAVVNQPTGSHNLQFRNNLVAKEGSGAAWVSLQQGTAIQMSNNLLRNVLGGPDNSATIAADPLLVNRGGGATGYVLHETSGAHNAGVAIPQNGRRDYFNNAVPATGPVDVGAYHGSGATGTAPPAFGAAGPNLVVNGGFETGTKAPWVTNWWTITGAGAHSGSYGARLNHLTNTGQILQEVTGLQPGATYLLSGWVVSPDSVSTSFYVQTYTGALSQSSPTWWHFAKPFTLPDTVSSATVVCHRGGTAPANTSCDDIALVRIG